MKQNIRNRRPLRTFPFFYFSIISDKTISNRIKVQLLTVDVVVNYLLKLQRPQPVIVKKDII